MDLETELWIRNVDMRIVQLKGILSQVRLVRDTERERERERRRRNPKTQFQGY